MDYKISLLKIVHDTIVDGVGFRTSVYCAGCNHHCQGCHNPDSWDAKKGIQTPINEIYSEIASNNLTNITFTGGDPMLQAQAFCELARLIKQNTNKNIWCYTGFLFEELKEKYKQELLAYIDVLVDGRFCDFLKDTTLKFRGSSNQRIIDVKKSLKGGDIVLWEECY